MHNVNFGDRYTAADRINWFYAKKAAQFKLSPTFIKVIKALILISAVALMATAIHLKNVELRIESNKLHNIVTYGDVNGFKPLK